MCGPLASLGAPGIILPAGPGLPLNKSPGCCARPRAGAGRSGRCPARACPGWPPEHPLRRVWPLKNFWSRSLGEGRGGAWEPAFLNRLCKQFRSTARLLMQDRGGKSAGVLPGPHSAVSAGTSPPFATVRAAHPCRLCVCALEQGESLQRLPRPSSYKIQGSRQGPHADLAGVFLCGQAL